MTLVDSELERQEKQRDVDSLILSDLYNLELAGVWIWDQLDGLIL